MAGTASSEARLRRFADGAALTEALAADIVAALQAAVRAGRRASFVVSGGHSPTALFERLSSEQLDWDRIGITLTDERWIDAASSDSNEHLVRSHLLRNAAAKAQFIGLKSAAAEPGAAAAASWAGLAPLARPFDYVLLGMGDDGHTASLFPDSPGLGVALDVQQPPGCVGMLAPQPPRARISLNLSALLNARRIGLLILGPGKWATYERACGAGAVEAMPVRALLRQQQVPVAVYWAP
jgi:6-phosphogluconolactonase